MQRINEIRQEPPSPLAAAAEPVKVVLVYDGFTGLIRAWEFWSELVGRLKNEIQIVCSAWQCTKLDQRQLETLGESGATVIVLPSHERSVLPDQFGSWLRIWTPWSKGRGGRSVAMLGQTAPDSATAILLRNCLRQIAEQMGMDFLCNADSEHRNWHPTATA